MKNVNLILLMLSACIALPTHASKIKVGTGGESGNYFSMMNDIKSYCEETLVDGKAFDVIPSGGSVDNLIGMGNKSYSVGIVQEDVLQYYYKQDPKRVNPNRLKIVTGLHTETFHLLIPKNFKPKGNDSLAAKFSSWLSDDKPASISIESLKGQSIGAVGGAAISAKALSYFLNLNMNVHSIERSDTKKAVAPILIVGGQPDSLVTELLNTKKYLLVGIESSALQATPFYIKSSANYQINGRLTTVDTIGVRAFLMGKSFRKDSRNANMIQLSKCIDDSLEDLADDSDTNPNWASVIELEDEGELTNWTYFPLN